MSSSFFHQLPVPIFRRILDGLEFQCGIHLILSSKGVQQLMKYCGYVHPLPERTYGIPFGNNYIDRYIATTHPKTDFPCFVEEVCETDQWLHEHYVVFKPEFLSVGELHITFHSDKQRSHSMALDLVRKMNEITSVRIVRLICHVYEAADIVIFTAMMNEIRATYSGCSHLVIEIVPSQRIRGVEMFTIFTRMNKIVNDLPFVDVIAQFESCGRFHTFLRCVMNAFGNQFFHLLNNGRLSIYEGDGISTEVVWTDRNCKYDVAKQLLKSKNFCVTVDDRMSTPLLDIEELSSLRDRGGYGYFSDKFNVWCETLTLHQPADSIVFPSYVTITEFFFEFDVDTETEFAFVWHNSNVSEIKIDGPLKCLLSFENPQCLSIVVSNGSKENEVVVPIRDGRQFALHVQDDLSFTCVIQK
jgi:hypothetical protein